MRRSRQAQGSRRILREIGQLKQAIDTNDTAGVKALMTCNPALHRARLVTAKMGRSRRTYGTTAPVLDPTETDHPKVPTADRAQIRNLVDDWFPVEGRQLILFRTAVRCGAPESAFSFSVNRDLDIDANGRLSRGHQVLFLPVFGTDRDAMKKQYQGCKVFLGFE